MEHKKDSYIFTIIIPTFNRKKYLIDTLGFIQRQTIQPVEIIVIDASEKDLQLEDVEVKSFGPVLNYIKWEEFGNISRQRNFAVNKAKGNYILFLDDDIIFSNDLIHHYITAFNETNADAISGVVETQKYPFGSKPIKYKDFLFDVGEENIQPCSFIRKTRVICTASFAIKTEILKKVNGFDELQRGVYDDLELGFRLSVYNVIHHPLPRVFHIQASASGARSSSLNDTWSLENRMYFQLKHRYMNKEKLFFLEMLINLLKPSRSWLKISSKINTIKMHIIAFSNTKQRIIPLKNLN